MLIPLPPLITSAVQAASPWPVTTTRNPMMYQPLDVLEEMRRRPSQSSSAAASSDTAKLLPASPFQLLSLFDSSKENNPFVTVAVALLYLSHGFPDECHALVTPLSWHEATFFSGEPFPNNTPEAEAAATYAHALIHRWEGSNVGELGMSGYSNAQYWGRTTLARGGARRLTDGGNGGGSSSSSSESLLQPVFAKVRQRIQSLLQTDSSEKFLDSQQTLSPDARRDGKEWFDEWILKDNPDPQSWEPRALTELCKRVEGKGQSSSSDGSLAEFCAVACQVELRVLMDYCWTMAGYDPDSVVAR